MPAIARPHILLVGCGKMGASLLRGWLQTNSISQATVLEPGELPFSDPRIDHIRTMRPDEYDMAILAVKPQILKDVCAMLKPHIAADLPVLSIAAGQTLAALESYFHAGQPVIRTMPNLPASIGEGMTAACANEPGRAFKDTADALMNAVGKCVWLDDEKLMDAVTAISGSGPAYVFYLIEALGDAAKKLGLPDKVAMQLARQTVIGSAALAGTEADIPAATLRENVTSPNGTTAAALSILMDGRFADIMKEATAKAAARSKELSQ